MTTFENVRTPPAGPDSTLAGRLATVTADDLRAAGSFKWTLFPGTLGAFIAEMDFGLAPAIDDAIGEALSAAQLGYLPHHREDDLAQACRDYLRNTCDWEIDADDVKAVPDVLRILELVLENLIEPDLPVIVPTPAYAPFLGIPRSLGRRVIEVPLARDASGTPVFDETALESALAGGGLLLLCNPYNPLGRVFTRDELERVSALVDRCGARVLSDEIHAPLVYAPHRHVPYASISPVAAAHTITATAATKAWNLPGLKCAQAILSNDADRAAWAGLGYFKTRGASNLGVVASTAAYRSGGPWLTEVLAYLAGNRDLLADRLSARVPSARHRPPEGTYLAWIDLSAVAGRRELAAHFRATAGLAITGGEECGAAGLGSIRLNFALPRHLLEEAVDRLAEGVSQLLPAASR